MRWIWLFAIAWAAGARSACGRADLNVRLAIIAPGAFDGTLAPFVAFKRERCEVETVALERVLAGGTGDDPERLKRWLYAAWKERHVTHVLLVGDADVLPVRYMVLDRAVPEAFDYAFYPSDLYYADVARADGSYDDWNARKDGFHAGYFGEVRGEKNKADPINFDAVDYRPELAIGRWPVSTPDEVSIVADKTMAAQRAVEEGRAGARAGFVMAGGWVDARPVFDRFVSRMPAAWSGERRYYQDGDAHGASALTRGSVVELLNATVFLIVHAGHGNDDVWEQCLSVDDLPRVTNAASPGVMISAGCSTARFATLPPYEAYEDAEGVEHKGTNAGEVFTAPPPPPSCYARGAFNRTGLGERLLRGGPGGAAAYIGCTTGSQPCALTLEEGFIDTLSKSPEARVGDCWAGAVRYYYERERLATIAPTPDWYPASIFFQGMKFMLFGDPTLPLPRGAGAGAGAGAGESVTTPTGSDRSK